MNLPYQNGLPVHRLAACFNNTSATYKFYWFLGILCRVEADEIIIEKHALFAEMISHCWFIINYFKVSFGKQDNLQRAVEAIKSLENISIETNKDSVLKILKNSSNDQTRKALWYFNSEVPHRFLSPWFPASDMKKAYAFSQQFTNNCLYKLTPDHIEINPEWIDYLQRNARILKDFCYWNLVTYLQNKNPNVPDIPNKLIKSTIRKNLTEQRRSFWDIVISELGTIECIYTNSKLRTGEYAVEHFLPYAFVAHDQIWNLLPADRSFNSSKSDKLPKLDKYFQPFFQLQKQAVEIIQHKNPRNRFLEDYLSLFPSLDENDFNSESFFSHIQPLVAIANNNGFEFMQ